MSDSYEAWRDRLAQANDPKFWPMEAVDSMILAGTAQFWCDGTAALVTRLVEYPGGAVAVEALAGAGDMDGLCENLAPAVEIWARKMKFTHLLITGRPGWARVHKDWKHHQSLLIKEL